MAKARFSKGLRTGSTKSETYSTLNTYKDGRIQIVKDRVYQIANPQTVGQMLQRVIFATVTGAAKHMKSLIEISREDVSNKAFARQQFIKENTEWLRSEYFRAGVNGAFAPKGEQFLVPNTYIISKGSLALPDAYDIRCLADGEAADSFRGLHYAHKEIVVPYGSYTVAAFWKILFGLEPGDQVTFVEISGSGISNVMYDRSGDIIDKTLQTQLHVTRLVLKKAEDMPSEEFVVDATLSQSTLGAKLASGVSEPDTYRRWINWHGAQVESHTEGSVKVDINPEIWTIGDFELVRALGVIVSRRDEQGKWKYSTSKLCCRWDNAPDTEDYFGFMPNNAMETYLKSAIRDTEGNFLQSGGEPDILPT